MAAGKSRAPTKRPRKTDEQRSEHLLRLEHRIALRLAEAAAPGEGLQTVLREICRAEDWDVGEFWRVDDAEDILRRLQHWVRPGFEAGRRFVESSADERPLQTGLAGAACKSGEPEWVADASKDKRAIRRSVSLDTGLRAGLVYPVGYAGRVLGVLSFACARIRRPDRRLLQSLNVIGSQVAQLLQRTQAEQTTRESEARFRSLTNLSSDWYWEQDVEFRFTRVEGRHVAGGDHKLARSLIGQRRWESGLDIEGEGGWDAHRALLAARKPFYDVLMWRKLPGGARRYMQVSGEPVFDAGGRFAGYRGVGRDITAQKRAEEALRESEARFRSLTQMSSDFFWETDARHRFTEMVHGQTYLRKFALSIIGKCAWELPTAESEAVKWAELRATMDAHDVFRDFEFSRPAAEGGRRYFAVSGEPRFAADGAFLGYRGVGRETTEIALAREHIASLAFSDPLTGLANRTSLGPAFEQAVERARRRGGKLAALFIDLDGFKPVNDAHGHPEGDRLLVEVARRLRANLRASDLVARLGGDEFFAVLEDMPNVGPLEAIARKLLAEIARPYPLSGGIAARVSASMGISIFPDDASDAAGLMNNADKAMYEAKQSGKGGFRFYSPGESARNRSNIT